MFTTVDPILLQPKPPNFETKKWALFVTCLISLGLWFNVFHANMLDYYYATNTYSISGANDQDSKTYKRWSRIILFLVSSTAIIGQIVGLVASLRPYRCCLNAHVWINSLVVTLVLIGLFKMFFSDPRSLWNLFSGIWDAAIAFTWLGSIVLGVLYRQDVRWMHKQKKLAQCNCLDLDEVQHRMAHARARSIQMNQVNVLVGGEAPPAFPPPHSQYIYGPDGKRYVVSRPPLQPPSPPPPPPPPKDSNDWLMMNMMILDTIL